MKVCHLSDTHLDDTRRPADTERVLTAFVTAARESGADLILHTGDLFERDSTESERDMARRFFGACADVAPVVGIRGNHDKSYDAKLLSGQRTKHPVLLFDRPTSMMLAPILATPGGKIGIAALPWFDRAHIAAQLPAEATMDDVRRETQAAARALLVGFGTEIQRIHEAGAVAILAHHGTVVGAKFSSGFVPRGQAWEFSAEELLATGADYVALGHYHATQEFCGGQVAYAGSTERTDLGEPEAKGFRLVTFEGGKFVSNEFVDLPARRIELIECDIEKVEHLKSHYLQLVAMGAAGNLRGALVRFRCRTRAEDLHLVDEDAIRRALTEAGAHEVTIEAVVEHQARIRSEAMVTATTLRAKVEAYWSAKGIDPDATTRDRVWAKLSEIEQPAGEAVAA